MDPYYQVPNNTNKAPLENYKILGISVLFKGSVVVRTTDQFSMVIRVITHQLHESYTEPWNNQRSRSATKSVKPAQDWLIENSRKELGRNCFLTKKILDGDLDAKLPAGNSRELWVLIRLFHSLGFLGFQSKEPNQRLSNFSVFQKYNSVH